MNTVLLIRCVIVVLFFGFSHLLSMATFLGVELEGKFMEYEDGRRESYESLVNALKVQLEAVFETDEFDGAIFLLAVHIFSDDEEKVNRQLGVLREWTKFVVTGAKSGKKEDGITWHSNLIYDLASKADEQILPHREVNLEDDEYKSTQRAVRLVLAGMNDRQRCNGETPKPHLMPTLQLIAANHELLQEVQLVLSRNHELSQGFQSANTPTKRRKFDEKYGRILQVHHLVEGFNAKVRAAGLSTRFEKSLNTLTGANAYNLFKGREEETQAYMWGMKRSSLIEQLNKVEMAMKDAQLTAFETQVCMWNLSEYVSRVWIHSQEPVNGFSDSPFGKEIVLRSLVGDFPANIVNADVKGLPTSRLYFLE